MARAYTLRNIASGVAAIAAASVCFGAANAADVPLEPLPAAPFVDVDSTAVFTGFNAKEDSYYGYLGVVHAWNGNIGTDGFLLRGFAGFGETDYQAGPLGTIDSDLFEADVMIGYQWFEQIARYTIYLGGHYRDNDLSPNDPGNSTRGDTFGAKIQAEAETLAIDAFYVSAIGSYSTAEDSYWARLRPGYNFGGITVGPEGIVMGNDEFDEYRIGGFVGGIGLGPINISLSAGYADTERSGGSDSVYGSIDLSTTF